jgi:hypothetical protein
VKPLLFSILLLLTSILSSSAQSYRGLSIVNDNMAWLSGMHGTILKTADGGKSWDTIRPAGFSKKDFRDIHAWDKKHAVVMSSGDTGVVLETYDAGQTWKLIYSDSAEGSFLDAMDVKDNRILIVGDFTARYTPYVVLLDQKRRITQYSHFAYATHTDLLNGKNDSLTFFAASGSNVKWTGKNQFVMIPVNSRHSFFYKCSFSSGRHLRKIEPSLEHKKFINIQYISEPGFITQKAGGAYGMCMGVDNTVYVVGGSFYHRDSGRLASFYSINGGKTWAPAESMPGGYRSGIAAYKTNKYLICTGTGGTDISTDSGKNWSPFLKEGYHVCAFSDKRIWLAGKTVKVMDLEDLILHTNKRSTSATTK